MSTSLNKWVFFILLELVAVINIGKIRKALVLNIEHSPQ